MRTVIGYICLFTLVSLISSCTKNVYIHVMHPAEIAIPADLDSLVVVDRTVPLKTGGKVGNVLESIITGEPLAGDRNGVNKTLDRIYFLLDTNSRVTVMNHEVVKVANINKSFTTDIPIRSKVIDSIVTAFNADGVLALEYFDSDRLYTTSPEDRTSVLRTSWKLYYPNEEIIIDEFQMETYGNERYNYAFISPSYKGIVGAGNQAAEKYIRRIVPSWYPELRTYYTKGCDELKIAKEYMMMQDWEHAKFILEDALNNNYKPKVLGRIVHNLSVIYEQLNDFQTALDYAYKARYANITASLRMIEILNTRINEAPLIEDQMIRE